MTIRVAHYISTSGLYGAERWLLALLNNISGVENVVFCEQTADDSLALEATKMGFKVERVPGNNLFSVISNMQDSLKKLEIDILHTHNYRSDVVGLLAARRVGIKAMSTPHGWSVNAGFKVWAYEIINRLFLKYFDLVVPLSEDLEKSLYANSRGKTLIVRNFVDLKTLPELQTGDINLISYVGQVIERKRIQDILQAMAILQNSQLKLQIVGDGTARVELEALTKHLNLEEQVQFLGYRNDRLELLNKSAIVILPSTLEGIPRCLMEGMAMGRLAIGTDIPGTRELITERKTGLLMEIGDAEGLARALQFALNNPDEVREISARGQKLIENEYSARAAAEKYTTLYNELKSTDQLLQQEAG